MKLPTPARLAADTFSLLQFDDDCADNVLINLLISERCNFACAHCLMRSSPKAPAGWLSQDDLLDIFEFADKLGNRIIEFNVVGGEPTLNLKALGMTLQMLKSYLPERQIQMTSNGWWFRGAQSFCNVMEVLTPYIRDETLALRISSSQFHNVYRKGEAYTLSTHKRLESAIEEGFPELREEAWEAHVAANPKVAQCGECSGTLTASDWECPHCEADVTSARSEAEDRVPMINKIYNYADVLRGAIHTHVHVDEQKAHQVTSNGRAADNQMSARGGGCGWGEDTIKFTFKPGALVHDFCCSGGPTEGGHAKDGLKLLLRRTLLLQELHADHPSNDRNSEDDASFNRCTECPTKSEHHMSKGSVWDKLVNKAYPLLNRMIQKYHEKQEAA